MEPPAASGAAGGQAEPKRPFFFKRRYIGMDHRIKSGDDDLRVGLAFSAD